MSPGQRLSTISRLLLCGFSLLVLVATVQHAFWPAPHESYLGLTLFFSGVILGLRTKCALCAIAFLLPWFGNRPGTAQNICLWYFLLGLHLSLSARYFRVTFPLCTERVGAWLGLGYLLAVLSVFGLPWFEIWWSVKSQIPSMSDFSVLSHIVFSLLKVREDHLWYSFSSLIIFGLAWHLAEILAIERESLGLASLRALVVGLLCSLLVGVSDYYQLIDLRWLRSLDPVVNPGDVQFRLQSTFGHSGWFAEYVTLAIPSVLVILSLPIRLAYRVGLIVLVLMLAEFVLILTFQRGGWLSYPLTLVAVWAAVYGVASIERGKTTWRDSLRKSFKKIAISVPITLLCSFLLIGLLNTREGSGSEWGTGIGRYFERFKDIKKTSDRTEFLHAGVLLGQLQPVLGNGNESFAWNFEREFEDPSGVYAGRIVLPLHGSAHNLFAQTFAGKGLLGLFALLALLLTAVGNAASILFSRNEVPRDRALVAFCVACFALACLIYGNVQEVFYVHSLIVLFFMLFAVMTPEVREHQRTPVLRSSLLLGALLLHVLWTWAWPTRISYFDGDDRRDLGCFGSGSPSAHWCRPRARIWSQDTGSLELSFPPELSNLPATVQVACQQRVVFEQAIAVRGAAMRIPTQLLEPCIKSEAPLYVSTRAYFIPARDLANSTDPRVLSFQFSWVTDSK